MIRYLGTALTFLRKSLALLCHHAEAQRTFLCVMEALRERKEEGLRASLALWPHHQPSSGAAAGGTGHAHTRTTGCRWIHSFLKCSGARGTCLGIRRIWILQR